MIEIYCDFVDFWPNFNKLHWINLFNKILNSNIYKLVLSKQNNNSQIIFGSVFGNEKYNYKCPIISLCGENVLNNKNYYDNIIKSNYIIGNYEKQNNSFNICFDLLDYYLIKNDNILKINDKINRKFCSFVVSNNNSNDRIFFFKKLCNYKNIDSGGKLFNSIKIGNTYKDKINFLSNYKFNICFENSYNNKYYITEKIRDALFADTLPIYKGGDIELTNFINKKCIIDCNNKSYDYIIDLIKDIDNNDDMYLEYFKEKKFINENYFENKYNEFRNFLINIIESL